MQYSPSGVNSQVDGTGPGSPGSSWLTSVSERGTIGRSDSSSGTVKDAFGRMLSDIEITDSDRDEASRQQARLRERLAGRVSLNGTFLTGSYRRNTQKRPLDDIDLFAILDEMAYGFTVTLDARGATRAIDVVEKALREGYPYTEIRRHHRGIQIVFAGTGIGFDVIPAHQSGVDEFWIPDESRGCWIRTNPKEQQRLVSEANQNRCGGMLVPEVKLLKTWNATQGEFLTGFHLEAMAYRALRHAPQSHQEGMAWLFQSLAESVRYETPDMWPLGERADGYLDSGRRTAASAALTTAAATARNAIAAESEGRIDEAHGLWFSLFGDFYPERGSRVSISDVASIGGFPAIVGLRSGGRTSASSSGIIPAAAGFASTLASTSHGGRMENDESDVPCEKSSAQSLGSEQVQRLEREIEQTLEQFPALARVTPAEAAADAALWPVTADNARELYAVLVGYQRSNLGNRHRILVAVPVGAPAIEARIYPLRHHLKRVPDRNGRFHPLRSYLHVWPDGAMCTHALRDHWDGRLVSLLIFAADWLVRQDYYQLTGAWLGRQMGRGGHLMINSRRVNGARRDRVRHVPRARRSR